ncbi:hypothetical protein Tco_0016467 [Tanacetum coccineum]
MDRRTHVMSAGFQTNMSRLFLSTSQSSIFPFSDRLPPIVTVCSGYSGCIATFILSATASSLGGSSLGAFATILHFAGIMVLLRSVTIPPSTRNLSIPWAVDGTAWTFLRPGRLMIPLYGNGDRTTIKFIKEFVECFESPKDTISYISPNGQDISPLNPRSGVVAGIIRLFTSGQSLLKQCLYNTSEADPPSTYMRWIRCPSTSASITIWFSCPSLFVRGEKEFLDL